MDCILFSSNLSVSDTKAESFDLNSVLVFTCAYRGCLGQKREESRFGSYGTDKGSQDFFSAGSFSKTVQHTQCTKIDQQTNFEGLTTKTGQQMLEDLRWTSGSTKGVDIEDGHDLIVK